MTKNEQGPKISQQDVEALMEKSMREPGIARLIEVYDRAEVAYARVSHATQMRRSYTSNSTQGQGLA